jgi:integration host factor subunit beta
MTKAELVELIAVETGISKKDTGIIVNLILDNIGRALVSRDKVELRGFGSFKVKQRRSRLARNPRTGDAVDVPAKSVPYFKASNELKARLNDGEGSGSLGLGPDVMPAERFD